MIFMARSMALGRQAGMALEQSMGNYVLSTDRRKRE